MLMIIFFKYSDVHGTLWSILKIHDDLWSILNVRDCF